jgi:hypothetical protein
MAMPAVARYIAVAAVSAAFAAALAAAAPVSGASAATAQQTITRLNSQRAANGLPAGIVENPTWSSDCAAHDRYMALNHALTHYENPGQAGYSSGGAYAGQNAALTRGGNWNTGNPYEYAPLHLDQLLAPRLITVGSADADGFSCTTTFPGWTRSATPALTVYTYPGDGSTIYASEIANELPWTPGDLVGIPQPARSGPNLIVLVDAPGQSPIDNPATLTGATLTGPSGAVQVRTVDGSTAVPTGPDPTLGPYISPGGFIIPVKPLVPGDRYHAHVLVTFAGVQTAHDWSFTTRGADPRSSLTARGEALSFESASPRPIRVTFTRPRGEHAPTVLVRPGDSVRLKLSAGVWRACGQQPPDAVFAAYDHCVAIIVVGKPMLRFGAPRVRGMEVRFPLLFGRVLRGRTATLTIIPLTLNCSSGACTTTRGQPATRTVLLRRNRTLSLPLPARGHGLRLMIATRAFQLLDAPWTAAHAVAHYVHV